MLQDHSEINTNRDQLVSGGSVDLKKAKELLNNLTDIRIELDDDVKGILRKVPLSSELLRKSAIRYYTGNRAGYIFAKDQLIRLMEQMTDDRDVVVLFEGCREDSQDTVPEPNKGKPTLIAFPYFIDGEVYKLKENPVGEEHPPIAVVDLTALKQGIPAVIKTIHSFTN